MCALGCRQADLRQVGVLRMDTDIRVCSWQCSSTSGQVQCKLQGRFRLANALQQSTCAMCDTRVLVRPNVAEPLMRLQLTNQGRDQGVENCQQMTSRPAGRDEHDELTRENRRKQAPVGSATFRKEDQSTQRTPPRMRTF